LGLASLLGSLVASGCGPDRGTIGALLAQRQGGRLVVREAPKQLAAERGGLEPGDEILLVDGRDVRQFDPPALHRALSGEVGEPVKLTVLREEQVFRVTLRRTPPPSTLTTAPSQPSVP
jgi:C-terminal processing protease CtpA/Prc